MSDVVEEQWATERWKNERIYMQTDCDYEFEAPVEDIDILRVLRENRGVGEEYVILMNDGFYMAFFAKSFAKRLISCDLLDLALINEEEAYGFNDPDTGESNTVLGKQIRSIGFTHGLVGRNTSLEMTMGRINALEMVEREIESQEIARKEAKANDTRPKRQLKIITGK